MCAGCLVSRPNADRYKQRDVAGRMFISLIQPRFPLTRQNNPQGLIEGLWGQVGQIVDDIGSNSLNRYISPR